MADWEIHRAELDGGLTVAYLREGVGGYPLVLLHGYPDTKRIWWRNIGPLAEAGFEVIVPDLRGFGDSGLAPDGFYDPPAHGRDVYRLVHDVLGHQRCGAAAGDLGGAVLQDLGLRFEGFVERQVIFNGPAPLLRDAYRAAGIVDDPPRDERPAADYYLRQGTDPEGLAAELDTVERRRAYIAEFYGHRLWAAPGAFTKADVDFMTEPFGDADKLRASWGAYEHACGTKPLSEVPRFFETNPIVDPGPLRPGRRRGLRHLPRAVRGGLPQLHRPVRGARGRPFPAVGAGRSVQPGPDLSVRRPAGRGRSDLTARQPRPDTSTGR